MFLPLVLAVTSCEEVVDAIEEALEEQQATGFNIKEEAVGAKSVPKDLSLVTLSNNKVDLSSKVMLTDFMPKIGNQGQYGTCTAWATAYYARTIVHARENNLNASDLANEKNIFSPLDIFLSTKGHASNCYGSVIYYAFQAMQERGVASLADVPYTISNKDCSGRSSATPAQYEPGKIEHFRKANVRSVLEMKSYLQAGCPVVVGCMTGSQTQRYDGGVLMDEDIDADGGHAMCVIGFDDNKGPNGAFCIANSWDTYWGEDGFLWVDYNFFTDGTYTQYGYVLEADKGTPPLVDDNVVNPEVRVDGKDLLAINLEDRNGDVTESKPSPGPRDRSVQYNVFNKGKQTVLASDDWNIIYYYYNAFDPENDFGIVFYDYYTDDVAAQGKSKGQSGDISDLGIDMATYGQWNWWNYVDVPAGYSVGKALDNGQNSDMVMDYELPADLNGEYYFVLFADGFNAMTEKYEQNNYMFFTGKDRKPIKITDGVIDKTSLKSGSLKEELAAYADELKTAQPNAYSIDEIATLINHQKKSGALKAAAKRYQSQLKSGSVKKAEKRFVPAMK
jgi:C1A family cysteine protease